MTALTGQFLRRPAVLLLDEPTNNLDLAARRRLYATVESWPGVMLIVSHDRELLGLMDQIADLRSDHYGDSLRMYGGNLAAYQAMLEVEQAAARRAVGAAEADVRRRRRVEIESQTKQAGRDRQGRKLAASGSLPRSVAGARKRAAQESAGRSRDVHAERVAKRAGAARGGGRGGSRRRHHQDLAAGDGGARGPDRAHRDRAGRLVDAVAFGGSGRRRPETTRRDGDDGALAELIVGGPERIALTGPNGAGKTTLLRIVAGQLDRRDLDGPGLNGPGLDRPGLDRPGLDDRGSRWRGTARLATCRSGSTCSTTR